MKKGMQVSNESPRWYASWIADLKRRYRATQIKAAVAVNSALIEFYWSLGKDIAEKYPGKVYGSKFFDKLGVDLRRELPGASGFTKVNLIYCLKFYALYSGRAIVPQVVEQSEDNPPVGILVCKEHNRVLAKFHLEKLGLPMGITDYQIKKLLPTQAQLAKCYADAERQIASAKKKGGGIWERS